MAKNMGKANQAKQELLSWLRMMFCVIVGTVLLFTLVLRIVRVDGDSMRDTLQNGDNLIAISRHLSGELENGDIVVVQRESFNYGRPIVKRVIAVEGQTVDIDFEEGIVIVDGEYLDEDYTLEPTWLDEGMPFPLTVPEDSYFLLGDNRNHSEDSRSLDLGTVSHDEVVGKVILLVVPGESADSGKREFSRMGLL